MNATSVEELPVGTPPAEQGEWRQLPPVFVDLVGSTAMSTRRDSETMRAIISAYQGCVSACAARFDGYVAKFMGDGALIYFGYPRAHENDAERAVMMDLAIVNAVEGLPGEEKLEARVGIATGLVGGGDLVRSGEAKERTIFGETPNLAARMQAAAMPGSLVVSTPTKALVGGRFEFEDLGCIEAKGFAAPVRCFRAVAPHESADAAAAWSESQFVGRSQPLDMLERAWKEVAAGQGRAALVRGEPGIGKSRLAEAFRARVSSAGGMVVRYACSSPHQDTALFPIMRRVAREAGLTPSVSDERIARLTDMVAGGTASPAAVLVRDLFSGRKGSSAREAQRLRERSIRILTEDVVCLRQRGPVLVVFEDIHWIDPTTGEALEMLVRELPTLGALMLATGRPELAFAWTEAPYVEVINLQ